MYTIMEITFMQNNICKALHYILTLKYLKLTVAVTLIVARYSEIEYTFFLIELIHFIHAMFSRKKFSCFWYRRVMYVTP